MPVDISRHATSLEEAARSATPLPPLSESEEGITVDDAYAIQREIVRRRLETGDRVVGWKVGLTSAAMQQQLGVDQPDYAPVLASMVVPDHGVVDLDRLIQPRIECEIAFILRDPLRGPDVTVNDVLSATDHVVAALEIIDSRIESWRISLADTIADLASSAAIVLGRREVAVADFDLADLEMSLFVDGVETASGHSTAVMGHPARAVAWTANTLVQRGVTLNAGHVVMSGAMHGAVPLRPGTHIVARSGALGNVSISVTAEGPAPGRLA